MHSAFGEQPFGDRGVPLRPRAAPPPRCEALPIGCLVATSELAVDPAVAQRLLERLLIRQAGGRLGRALLGKHQPDAGRLVMVLTKPFPPGTSARHQQLLQLDRHPSQDAIPGSLARQPNSRVRTPAPTTTWFAQCLVPP